MNIYTIIITEFLLLSSCILLLFKLRARIGLAPLYILLGAIQYLQANLGSTFSFNVFSEYVIYPGSIILFSGVLFAVLLIYIKEGVASARALIIGIVVSNIFMSLMFEVTYLQEIVISQINNTPLNTDSVFNINFEYFFSGTVILLVDFFLLVILYQYLILKFNKLPFFLILFTALCTILVFDAIVFNVALFYGTPLFATSLLSHVLGKSLAAFLFSIILYLYVKHVDSEHNKVTFVATQERDIFSILNYRQKYNDLKIQKKEDEKRLTSQLETTLNNISDGFVSLDTNWCYTFINQKAADFLEKTPSSLIGKHIWTEFPSGVGTSFYEAYYRAVETQQTQSFQEYYKPLGKWFDYRVYPSDEGLFIYFTDITEQKTAEIALKESEYRLRTILETEPECIKQLNAQGELIYMNPAGLKMIEADSLEMVKGNSVINIVNPNYHDAFNKIIIDVFNGGSGKLEFEITGIKGTKRWLETHAVPLRETNGDIVSLLGVTRDVSDRKNAEAKLIKNEALFRSLTSNAPVAIFQTDKDGACNYVNEEWVKYAEKPFEAALGSGWSNTIHPEDRERVLKEWQGSIKTNTEFTSEFRFQNEKKQVTWLSAKAVGLYDNQNNLYGYIGMALDITKAKNAKKRLIESKEYLDNIINNIGDPVFVKDDKSRFLIANNAFYNLFNRTKEEIIGRDFADDVLNEERERYLNIDKQVISEGVECVYEDDVNLKDGKTRFISTKKTRFIDGDGNKLLIGVIRDITELKTAENLVKESKEYLNNIINNIGDPVFVKDDQHHILLVNDAFCVLFNLSRADIIGKTLAENLPQDESESFLRIDKEVLRTGVENLNEERFTFNGKETRIIATKKTRFIDGNGNKFLIGVIRDITKRKKAEVELENHKHNLEALVESRTSELEKEKIKAQSADLMKSAFLATMSHELRTPMNSIIGFTGILIKELAGPLNEEQKKQLEMVKNSGVHLLSLINDVLDISKIEAGKLKVSFYYFDYLKCLEKTTDFLLPQVTGKGLKLVTEISAMDIGLISDERRVEQILLNLLSNAIKFSKKGTILIKVDVVDNMVITQVIDEGIGISKDDIVKLFMPFIQIEGGLNRNHEGTGLGLAISKNLIEKLGGTIEVESQLGVGSNFTFKLPLEYSKDKIIN
ncbi:MAG: PAS domain S-box protein [Algibacter sp.]|uniref:PAS domain S-box protein n=1 Tax=Algibacter sp. TaxID=1872428 RepID=UPI003296A5AA